MDLFAPYYELWVQKHVPSVPYPEQRRNRRPGVYCLGLS